MVFFQWCTNSRLIIWKVTWLIFNVNIFGRKCPLRHRGMFEVIMNIKIIGLKDQILLSLQLKDGDISRLTSSHPSLHLRFLLMHMQTFYPEVASFTKNGDKFGWVKYWRMTFNFPNSPKFSSATFLHYMVTTNHHGITTRSKIPTVV